MTDERIDRTGKNFLEIITALILVFLFFGILLVIMNRVFPVGGGLGLLLAGKEQNEEEMEASTEEEESLSGGTQPLHATLAKIYRTVKNKKANHIAWQEASEGLLLFDRDAVQTFKRSSAEVAFDENSRLFLGENSLIIISLFEEDPALKEKRSFLVMVDGEMRGRVRSSGGVPVQMEIAAPGGKIRVAATAPGGGETDFRLKINADKSSTLSVLKGEVEMMAGEATIALKKNETALLGPGEGMGKVRPLPEKPRILSPMKGKAFYFRDLPPKVNFSWRTEKGGKTRFMLARDPHFRDILVDERISEKHFTHGNLRKGLYYWKASRLEGNYESDFSRAESFHIIRDNKAPSLEVHFPKEIIQEKSLALEGTTEPGITIYSGEEKIRAGSDGRFTLMLDLREGVNVIVVEAVDKAGNSTYRSKTVNVKL
ncbi:MAG: FecR domain-containing protein [Deltaproteobacteria bacterium]|nr:FecR domain-containing protein [Deltaproteobacteria bacterium]